MVTDTQWAGFPWSGAMISALFVTIIVVAIGLPVGLARATPPITTFPGAHPTLLEFVEGLAVDNRHSSSKRRALFVPDHRRHLIFRIESNGKARIYAGNGHTCSTRETCGDGGNPRHAEVGDVRGLAITSHGALLINDINANRVRIISPDGEKITTFARPAAAFTQFHGEPGASPGLGGELAVGPDDSVYMVDGLSRVRRIKNGLSTIVAGAQQLDDENGDPLLPPSPAPTLVPQSATHFRFGELGGILVTPNSDLLIANKPRGFTIPVRPGWVGRVHNGQLTLFAGGPAGSDEDHIPAVDAHLRNPGVMTNGPHGSVLIAEGDRLSRVRKVASNGVITTFVGTSKGGYSADNRPATKSRLYLVNSLASSADGLYIVDFPVVRFVPWTGKSLPWQRPLACTQPPGSTRLETLHDILAAGAAAYDLKRNFLDEANSLPPRCDARFLNFYLRVLSKRLNWQDRIKTEPLLFNWDSSLRTPSRKLIGQAVAPAHVQPDILKVLRFLTSQVTEPMVRTANPKLAETDHYLRLNLGLYTTAGMRETALTKIVDEWRSHLNLSD